MDDPTSPRAAACPVCHLDTPLDHSDPDCRRCHTPLWPFDDLSRWDARRRQLLLAYEWHPHIGLSTEGWPIVEHPVDADLLLVDLDSTLRYCHDPAQPAPTHPDDWALLPNVCEVLARYDFRPDSPRGLCAVSNQGGVARGYLTAPQAWARAWETLAAALDISSDLRAYNVDVQLCLADPTSPTIWRKPGPAMLWAAMADRDCWPHRAVMVGDSQADEEAAKMCRVPFIEAGVFFGWPGWSSVPPDPDEDEDDGARLALPKPAATPDLP